jgi:hypothetical protein
LDATQPSAHLASQPAPVYPGLQTARVRTGPRVWCINYDHARIASSGGGGLCRVHIMSCMCMQRLVGCNLK